MALDEEDLIKTGGLPFLPHLLRRLSDLFVRDFENWIKESGGIAPPRTHSTLFALSAKGPLSVTELAKALSQSHQLVITWVRQLKSFGLIFSEPDSKDARRTVLNLTPAGVREVEQIRSEQVVLAQAFHELLLEADAQVFDALWRVETGLRTRPLIDRLRTASNTRR